MRLPSVRLHLLRHALLLIPGLVVWAGCGQPEQPGAPAPTAKAAQPAPPPETAAVGPTLKLVGSAVDALSLKTLQQMPGVATVTVDDPLSAQRLSYRGVPFSAVLDRGFGPQWRQRDELLFTCADGYQPAFPVSRVAEHAAWLVWERVMPGEASPAFRIPSRKGGEINLSPLYLVWADGDGTPKAEGWLGPYQITGLELITLSERFPRLSPPPGVSAQVIQGFGVWRGKCMKCHTLNGEGGRMGPELNYPVSVMEYWQRPMLARWIRNPAAVRLRAGMAGVKISDPDLEALLAYLEAMSGHKQPPPGHE